MASRFIAFIFFMSLALFGCQKIEETPPSLGNQVDAQSILNEFQKIESQLNPFETREGDALGYLINVSVEGPGNVKTQGLLQREVLGRSETSEGVEYKILNKDYEIKDNVTTEVRNETCLLGLTTKITYTCPSDPTTSSKLAQGYLVHQKILREKIQNSLRAMASADDRYLDSTYYGLQVAEEQASPPDVVKNRANCSGLSPCSLHIYHIQYDELEKYASGRLQRLRWNLSLTPDLMYLGPRGGFRGEGIDYSVCVSLSVDYQGRPVLLKQCIFVYDLLKAERS